MLDSNFPAFVRGCAHEYAKLKKKNPKLPADDEGAEKYYQDFVKRLECGGPKVKEVVSVIQITYCVHCYALASIDLNTSTVLILWISYKVIYYVKTLVVG